MKARLPILSLFLLMTACTGAPMTAGNPGLYTIPVGTVLVLNQPLVIPAGKARAGIQNGKPTLSSGIDKWSPYCEFLVNTISTEEARLPAGNYRVTRIQRDQIPTGGLDPAGRSMLALAGTDASQTTMAGIGIAQGGGAADQTWLYRTTIRLESDVYPDVRQLECGNTFGTGFEARHLTLEEFRQAVGDVITLRFPGQ